MEHAAINHWKVRLFSSYGSHRSATVARLS